MPDYSLAELAALSNLPPRTIRYYIAEGLVASPGREGPSTRYPESTLARLRLIARLRDAHQPLGDIRARLSALADDQLAALTLAPPPERPPDTAIDYIRAVLGDRTRAIASESEPFVALAMPAPMAQLAAPMAVPASPQMPQTSASTPTEFVQPGTRSQWDRIQLADGIELHIRRPLSRRENRVVDRIVVFAKQLQGEDPL